jgi:hypothetical protein
LAPRLRRIDRIECEAMGRTGEQALRHGLVASVQTWTALIDGEPEAMFGVVVACAASGEAIPWFLGGALVASHARALIGLGPEILAAMHRHGRCLCNFVSCDNRAAIRLLEHWGFFVEPEPIAVRGIAFRRFIRENV